MNVPASAVDASIVPDRLADAKFTTSVIDYDSTLSRDGDTVGGYLKHPVFFDTVPGFNSSVSSDNSFLRFTGKTFLNAGVNSFVTPHDDGVVLTIHGIGIVLDQPGPTSPVDTPFVVNAPVAGLYDFTLQYGECCGPPARLAWTVNGLPPVVPEPSVWATLGLGLLGGLVVYRRRLHT